jgi:drug/metabolite transporter (DMT)-like permease
VSGLSKGTPARRKALHGIFWMIGAAPFFAISYLPVRELSDRFTPFELVFYRALLAVLSMLPWLARAGLPALKTDRIGLYFLRGAMTFIGMACLFYGFTHMLLADATALIFTAPLFTIVIGAIALGDRVGGRRWWPVLAVVVTAMTYGASNAVTRALT